MITRPVHGYEGLYAVTDDGKVFRVGSSRPLSVQLVNSGYLSCELWKNNQRKRIGIHVLVAEAWLRARGEGECVRHKDGNRLNNSLGNLELGSRADNERDKIRHGRANRGERHGLAVLTESDVAAIRSSVGESSNALASRFGISSRHVRDIRSGRRWTHVLGGSDASPY